MVELGLLAHDLPLDLSNWPGLYTGARVLTTLRMISHSRTYRTVWCVYGSLHTTSRMTLSSRSANDDSENSWMTRLRPSLPISKAHSLFRMSLCIAAANDSGESSQSRPVEPCTARQTCRMLLSVCRRKNTGARCMGNNLCSRSALRCCKRLRVCTSTFPRPARCQSARLRGCI